MSCITKLLEMKGDNPVLPLGSHSVIEGGGKYKGYEYIITFIEHGHRCGYVALKEPETAKFLAAKEQEEFYYPDIDCHGGVTFFDNQHPAKELLLTPCGDYWIGFDASHAIDAPDVRKAEEYFGETRWVKFRKENPFPSFGNVIHRDYEYMESECKGIIDQLVAGAE